MKKRQAVDIEKIQDDGKFDFFESADAGAGAQFRSVRPYVGAIDEPDEHNDESRDPSDVTYSLE